MIQKKLFSEFDFSPEMHRAIASMEFSEPTPIQIQAIEPVLQGDDIVGQAQTGSGKTAAFGIPIIERIDPSIMAEQALILCPTRELALQISEELKSLSRFKRGIQILPVYGGQPIERQIKPLKKGVQIVVGTPGRIRDHITRRTLTLNSVKMVVLDEADEMLDMGFIDDMRFILGRVERPHQTLLFSATMPKEVLELSRSFQKEPKLIRVGRRELTVPEIDQSYYVVKERDKTEVLARLIGLYELKLALIFCNTKRRVDELVQRLEKRGYAVAGLHGAMRQGQRERVMDRFRNRRLDMLVATDVAARGIDVSHIDVVVNYDVPREKERYVHRIGRTARAGRSGKAITFVYGPEQSMLADIQEYAHTSIQWQPVPLTTSRNQYLRQVPEQPSLVSEDHREKVPGVRSRKSEREDNRRILRRNSGCGAMARLFINLGRSQRIGPGDIVGAITGETALPGKMIGVIDIRQSCSFVEVSQAAAASVIDVLSRCQIKGYPVKIEHAAVRESRSVNQTAIQ